jgi:L,D-transpeptidase YcbB
MFRTRDQTVDFVRDGKVVLTSKAIIGRKNSTTPIIRTMIKSVIANPAWDVPGDLAAASIVPKLRKNPNYLAEHHMVIVKGQFRQLPPSALGQVMLDSPNDFDVYLHDTPGKARFEQDNRELSNGCVRVQQILPLAALVLADDREAGMDRLKKTIASGREQHLALDQPMALYMVYWTAVAGEDGTVEFRPDRYNRDKPLIAALT